MIINVTVSTRSSKNEVIRVSDTIFRVKVTTAPERGKANEKVIQLLADYFKVAKFKITIKAGKTVKNKLIEIAD